MNALFWGNRKDDDIAALCDAGCDKLTVQIAHSMVQTGYETSGGAKVVFGERILTPSDPRFADAAKGDYHLRSAAGRWTPSGRVKDDVTSPAVGAGTPIADGQRRELRVELGALRQQRRGVRRPLIERHQRGWSFSPECPRTPML